MESERREKERESTHRAADVVQEPVVVRPAEVDVELVLGHADRLQADVQDVLWGNARAVSRGMHTHAPRRDGRMHAPFEGR